MRVEVLSSTPLPELLAFRQRVLAGLIQQGRVTMGEGSYGTPEVNIYEGDTGSFVVGRYCSIGDDVRVIVGGNHRVDTASTYPFRACFGLPGAYADGYPHGRGDVVVGNDVWIGRGALLLSGVVIGDGAVISAGAVVSRPVRSYAVVAGNPATEIRRRFDDGTVAALTEIAWWNWPLPELLTIVPLLNDMSPDGLIAYASRRESSAPASRS